MDIKQLKFLIALDQTRHFGKAAELCHVTQPTLSMRIRSLEEELDLVLVARGQRFEGFTEAGERVLAWAKTILSAYDGLQAEAANCRGQLVGTLRLGTVPLSSMSPMELVKPLSERYPELRFQISSMSSEQVFDGLSRNQLDLGMCYLDQQNTRHFEVVELGPSRMGLLHDERFFTFDAPEIAWEDLDAVPLGTLTKIMHFQQSIALRFRSLGLEVNSVLESDSTFQLVQAVSSGICCAIMPLKSGVDSLSDHLRLTPITDGSTNAPMGLLMRKTEPQSPLARQCFEEAKAIFALRSV
ncbi:LysR family transcriptional regulator [Marinobacter zhejiangensis]|uniref:Transcriptional regulator, LysR family n=1 Tax=Marinobacter zhejiangensis TaxID=488535 RepID=A0A1I4PFF5_9GAMM|nr:LysR family transcriptional regulator [Marinobacter zhejiangensis]SFM26305.1 transcriptional regulator, LysR family [Marinobacter zhejiangensis]